VFATPTEIRWIINVADILDVPREKLVRAFLNDRVMLVTHLLFEQIPKREKETELVEAIKSRPELKKLFDVARTTSPRILKKAIKVIEAVRDK